MSTQTVKKIIDDRGGSAAVARALHTKARPVRKSTVHSWCTANKLPWWREDAVMALPKMPKSARRAKAAKAVQQAAA